MNEHINTSPTFNYKPFVVVVVLVAVFALGWYFLSNKTKNKFISGRNVEISPTVIIIPTPVLQLPAHWERKENAEGFQLKVVKKTDAKIKPAVNLVKTIKKSEDSKTYVNKMIKGAKSSFPSLSITKDILEEKDGFYIRELTGNYYNGKNKIALQMNVYIKNDIVYTLTAARDSNDNSLNEEITQILTVVYKSIIIKG